MFPAPGSLAPTPPQWYNPPQKISHLHDICSMSVRASQVIFEPYTSYKLPWYYVLPARCLHTAFIYGLKNNTVTNQ